MCQIHGIQLVYRGGLRHWLGYVLLSQHRTLCFFHIAPSGDHFGDIQRRQWLSDMFQVLAGTRSAHMQTQTAMAPTRLAVSVPIAGVLSAPRAVLMHGLCFNAGGCGGGTWDMPTTKGPAPGDLHLCMCMPLEIPDWWALMCVCSHRGSLSIVDTSHTARMLSTNTGPAKINDQFWSAKRGQRAPGGADHGTIKIFTEYVYPTISRS